MFYAGMALLEKKYDAQFSVVFDALRELNEPPDPPKKEIGFHVREPRATYRIRPRRKMTRGV